MLFNRGVLSHLFLIVFHKNFQVSWTCPRRRFFIVLYIISPLLYVIMSSAVSRWDTYLSETHCKLRRSAAVGKQRRSHSLLVPRSGTYVLSSISLWLCQSRFAELLGRGCCRPYPQLRCFAACNGFLMVGPALRNLAACGSLVVLRRLTVICNFLPLATSVTV